MKNDYQAISETLYRIYQKHLRKYRNNPDSRQMCCMWPTYSPPDIIEDTPPFYDIEEAFGITIDEDTALMLYNMHLDEAARKIMDMRLEQLPK